MAFSFGETGAGRRRRGLGPMAEINIIPLVDVVLVLLVIFMLTAHVMEFGLEVDVPKVKQVRDSAQELPMVTLSKDGEIQLNEASVSNINLLGAEVRKRFPDTKEVYVRADKSVMWEQLAQVFSMLGEAKLGVRAVTQPLEESPVRRR